ncbi:MAG TPA: hypothetical protein VIS07_07985 [Candidatus Binatia bacterium]
MASWTCEVCGCGVEAPSAYLVRAMGWRLDWSVARDSGPAVCPRCARSPLTPRPTARPTTPRADADAQPAGLGDS